MTGRRYTVGALVCDSREERELWVPLPWYFTMATGSALALASLSFHGVHMHIEFEDLTKLIVVSGPNIGVVDARTLTTVNNSSLRAAMEICYVYLDEAERTKFQTSTYDQLMVQTQSYIKTDSKKTCSVPLSFNHPTLEMIICVRRHCSEKANNWTNFSGIDGRDPIKNMQLFLNSASRFGKKSGQYWRTVIPY